MDPHTFKVAMSRWTSGVAVITAQGADGAPAGFTASSFTSLSLEPPMVLFCLGRASRNFATFSTAAGFAVHILGAGQEALSQCFASRERRDRFAGVAWRWSAHGVPVLEEALAVLECRTAATYPGGDHLIVTGEVLEVRVGDGAPLVYLQGAFRGVY